MAGKDQADRLQQPHLGRSPAKPGGGGDLVTAPLKSASFFITFKNALSILQHQGRSVPDFNID